MRNLAEATILVTGATDGLGKRVAGELAAKGTTVLLHGRSPERLEATLEELRGQTSSQKVGSYLADLSSLAAVRDLADRILSEYDRLDVLVNNAGIIVPERKESEDGHELTFAVNYLSHFLLTSLLLQLLKDSAPARVVNVASAGQSPIDWTTHARARLRGHEGLLTEQTRSDHVHLRTGRAPLGHRSERERPAPGISDGYQDGPDTFGYTMGTVEEGSEAVVRLAVSPELEGVTGRYFDGKREARADGQAYDKEARQTLWELSEELCGRPLDPKLRQP